MAEWGQLQQHEHNVLEEERQAHYMEQQVHMYLCPIVWENPEFLLSVYFHIGISVSTKKYIALVESNLTITYLNFTLHIFSVLEKGS